jgi:hypothetical protein
VATALLSILPPAFPARRFRLGDALGFGRLDRYALEHTGNQTRTLSGPKRYYSHGQETSEETGVCGLRHHTDRGRKVFAEVRD